MLDEEEDLDLSSSRSLSYLPPPPEPFLMNAWMVASTVNTPGPQYAATDKLSVTTGCRWTRFLALWLSLRLAGLIASSESRDGTQWDAMHRELEVCEHSFLLTAWPLLPAGQRERILLRLAHLRLLWSQTQAPNFVAPASTNVVDATDSADDDNSYDAACRVISYAALHASQCVARDYLRITWDVLSPKEMPGAVDGRLHTLFAIAQSQHRGRDTSPPQPALSATAVVHTSCMGGLLQTLQRTQQQQHHTADPTHRVWMRSVRTALLQVGFDVVVKVRAAMMDVCYAALPALIDFEACVQLCEVIEGERAHTVAGATAASGDEEEGHKREQLRRTVAALLQAVESFYGNTIDKLLTGYRKQCTSVATPPRLLTAIAVEAPINPFAPPLQATHVASSRNLENASPVYTTVTAPAAAASPAGGGGDAGKVQARQQLALSQAAYALLVEVVEPTCNLLRRYTAERRFTTKANGADAATRRAASALFSDIRPLLQRPQTSERDAAGAAVRENGSSSAASRASVTVIQAFTKFFAKKLDVCFTEALSGSRSSTPSTKSQEQAAMDTHIVASYLSAALRI